MSTSTLTDAQRETLQTLASQDDRDFVFMRGVDQTLRALHDRRLVERRPHAGSGPKWEWRITEAGRATLLAEPWSDRAYFDYAQKRARQPDTRRDAVFRVLREHGLHADLAMAIEKALFEPFNPIGKLLEELAAKHRTVAAQNVVIDPALAKHEANTQEGRTR